MELFGFILLVIIVLFAWSQLPDDGRTGNFKWFLALLPLIIIALPVLPGVGLHLLLTDYLGWKKNGVPGFIAVVFTIILWSVGIYYWLKSA